MTMRVMQTRNVNANTHPNTNLPFSRCFTACRIPRSWDHTSPSHEESWKPFLIDVDGGGGGGTPAPGLSGGGGGRGPLLGLSTPLDGNCGVAGRARDVLPFLFIGGGGGRGPGVKEKPTFRAIPYIFHHQGAVIVCLMDTGPLLENMEKWWTLPRRFSQARSRHI